MPRYNPAPPALPHPFVAISRTHAENTETGETNIPMTKIPGYKPEPRASRYAHGYGFDAPKQHQYHPWQQPIMVPPLVANGFPALHTPQAMGMPVYCPWQPLAAPQAHPQAIGPVYPRPLPSLLTPVQCRTQEPLVILGASRKRRADSPDELAVKRQHTLEASDSTSSIEAAAPGLPSVETAAPEVTIAAPEATVDESAIFSLPFPPFDPALASSNTEDPFPWSLDEQDAPLDAEWTGVQEFRDPSSNCY